MASLDNAENLASQPGFDPQTVQPVVCFNIDYDIPALKFQQSSINLSKLSSYVMHQQFNIKQLYVLPTLYLCVLYLSDNKRRLVPLTA